jgi:hypothetical protein
MSSIFWDITPCSPLRVNRRFGGIYRLHTAELCLPPAFTLVSCSAYSSTLKMEAICFSETSVDFQRTTWRYIQEDSTLHNQRCENLKSYIFKISFVIPATLIVICIIMNIGCFLVLALDRAVSKLSQALNGVRQVFAPPPPPPRWGWFCRE